ncbi:hypothetical protein [Haloparvum sedimenti]|uniref:hypothetical protein n=1 Tax=Haloparvum sedimenti TaxID=1678448 RepID=UPI00071E715B|nr:hypothetical protein [Haloparvum sedimenti]
MSSSRVRVYAAASGQCLVRDADGVDEAERDLVQRDFHAGVRLVVDPDREEIRGIVPARRRSEELFYAVVCPGGDESLSAETFHAAVAEVFSRHDRWAIRTDTPEGDPFRRFLRNSGESPTEGTRGERPTDVAPEEIDGSAESVASLLRERDESDPPVAVGVSTFGAGLALLDALRESGLDPASAGGAVIARTARTDHLAPGLAVRIRDDETGMTVLAHGSRDIETDGADGADRAPDDDGDGGSERAGAAETPRTDERERTPRIAGVVGGAALLGGVLLTIGGIAGGAPLIGAVGIGVTAALLLMWR